MYQLTCKQCGETWNARKQSPRRCHNCKSRFWKSDRRPYQLRASNGIAYNMYMRCPADHEYPLYVSHPKICHCGLRGGSLIYKIPVIP